MTPPSHSLSHPLALSPSRPLTLSPLNPLALDQVKPFSQKLIQALLPHILHRHGSVRLAVLGALEELLLCGAGQSVETLTGWRLKNNVPVAEFYGKGEARINYLADLSRDRSVAVRRKFIRVVARWCREMDGEDLYEQEVRIGTHTHIYISSHACAQRTNPADGRPLCAMPH